VHEYVFAAIVADDEAETLLRIEEFDNALALANDLRRHSATAAAAKTAAAGTAAAESTAAATAEAAWPVTSKTAAAAAAKATASAAAITAAFLESASLAETRFFEKPVALVPAATATIAFAPSIETHSV